MKTVLAAVAASIGLAAAAAPAHAAYVINFREVGSDIVATGEGSFDLTGLTFINENAGLAEILPEIALVDVGGAGGHAFGDLYRGILGPTAFGSGNSPLHPISLSGPLVQLAGGAAPPRLLVQPGYVSGAALGTSTAVYSGSFASAGITPGTYVWKWGQGDHADSLTLNIGGVPEPAAWAMLILGAGMTGAAVRRRRLSYS